MENEYSCPWQLGDLEEKLLEDKTYSARLRAVSAAGEELLHHATDQASEEFQNARKRFSATLSDIKRQAIEMEAGAEQRVRVAAARTDLYVKKNPWQAVGMGAAAAGLLGVIAGLLISRR